MRTYTGTHRIYNLREICWSGEGFDVDGVDGD